MVENVVTDFLDFSITHVMAGGRDAPRDGKNMFSTSDGGAEIEQVAVHEGWARKLFITLSFRANSRESRRDAMRQAEVRRDVLLV